MKKETRGKINYILLYLNGMAAGALIVTHYWVVELLAPDIFDTMASFAFVGVMLAILVYTVPSRRSLV